jgi:uncharacterized protein YgfB (UPF0149 family)
MFEDAGDGVEVFDFDELADELLEQGVQASPSQLHGCLAGLLSAGGSEEPEYGLDALGQALDIGLHGQLAGLVLQLYRVTAAALQQEEFDFHPLLPDDDTDIETRTEALADWCKGFLAGFAQVTSAGGAPPPALSDESSEILRDVGAMSEATVGEEESEEESEESYTELVEYLRFAALNVYLGNRVRDTDPAAPGGEPQLH